MHASALVDETSDIGGRKIGSLLPTLESRVLKAGLYLVAGTSR
jgi:hypothetical protein